MVLYLKCWFIKRQALSLFSIVARVVFWTNHLHRRSLALEFGRCTVGANTAEGTAYLTYAVGIVRALFAYRVGTITPLVKAGAVALLAFITRASVFVKAWAIATFWARATVIAIVETGTVTTAKPTVFTAWAITKAALWTRATVAALIGARAAATKTTFAAGRALRIVEAGAVTTTKAAVFTAWAVTKAALWTRATIIAVKTRAITAAKAAFWARATVIAVVKTGAVTAKATFAAGRALRIIEAGTVGLAKATLFTAWTVTKAALWTRATIIAVKTRAITAAKAAFWARATVVKTRAVSLAKTAVFTAWTVTKAALWTRAALVAVKAGTITAAKATFRAGATVAAVIETGAIAPKVAFAAGAALIACAKRWTTTGAITATALCALAVRSVGTGGAVFGRASGMGVVFERHARLLELGGYCHSACTALLTAQTMPCERNSLSRLGA